jgi:uncharacterized membrane protein
MDMSLLALFQGIHMPEDANTNTLMLLRWVHFLAGITWIGLLYFFNLVNVPFMKEIDAATKGKVVPSLLPKALWWFRWGAVVTVLAGIWYWMMIVGADKRNAEGAVSAGQAIWSFFLIWTVVWAIVYVLITVLRINKGMVLAVIMAVVVIAAAWLYLSMNSHGWESNRLLSIGIGGGLGWVMMLNVWGIIWRNQKKIIAWTKANANEGTAIPAESATLARHAFLASRMNAWFSLPMLFFMAAASHYPMFTNIPTTMP